MQRRIERADDHRESVHGVEQTGEILALEGQQFGQGFAAGLLVARQNHGLHVLDAVLGEEHVLGAAQPDAFRAELAGSLGVARDIRVGANAELAAELVGPVHEVGQNARARIGVDGVGLAGEHFTGRAVERKPVAFLQRERLAASPEQ